MRPKRPLERRPSADGERQGRQIPASSSPPAPWQRGWELRRKSKNSQALSTGGWTALGAAALVAGALLVLATRREPLPSGAFLLVAVLLAASIQIAYVNAFELNWIDDFAGMWQLVGEEVAQRRFSADCAIPDIASCGLKAQRTLPILWPAVYLWGHHAGLVPLLNGALLLLILLMGWDGARLAHGQRAAQIFAVLWIGCAETVFALRIPTHDLWGLFFIALLYWLVLRGLRRPQRLARSLGCGVAFGVAVLLLEVQRELGLVALAALAVTVLLLRRNRALQRSLALALVTCVLAFAGGLAGLKQVGVLASGGETAYLAQLRTFALVPAYSGGSWWYGQVLGDSLLKPLPPEARTEMARTAVLSDFTEQPLLRLATIVFKASMLAPLGNQTYFYQPGLQQNQPALFAALASYNGLYCVLLAVLVLVALASALRSKDLAVAFPLAFMGVLIGGLVTVGEIQPRYLFPVWFLAPLVVASQLGGASRADDAGVTPPLERHSLVATLLVGALALLGALTALWWITDKLYTPQRGRVLTNFSFQAEGVSAAAPVAPLQLDRLARTERSLGVGRLGFTLRAAQPSATAGIIVASTPACVPKNRSNLRFAYVMPYANPDAGSAFTLQVSFGGRMLWSQTLPNDGKIHNVEINPLAPAQTCAQLDFSLRNNHPLWDGSWSEASRTEIYFPRFSRY